MEWGELDNNIMIAKEKHRQGVVKKLAKGWESIEFDNNETTGEPDPIGDLEKYLNKCLGVEGMEVNLKKKDLISLVKGSYPNYDLINKLERKDYGKFYGGHGGEKWIWNDYTLEDLTEQQLYDVYQMCKKSWEI